MNVIILKAYKPHKNPEVVLRPAEDASGNLFTGQGKSGFFNLLTETEKKRLPYLVTPATSVKLTDGTILNVENNEKDKINWEWMKKHPYITERKEEHPSPNAVFYVYDPQKNASERVSRERRRTMILAKIYGLSETDQRNLAGGLGLGDSSGLNIDQVMSFISDKVETDVTLVETLTNRKDLLSAKNLFYKAKQKNIIIKENGWFKYGDHRLGTTEDMTVENMLDPANAEIVLAVRAGLEEVE